MDAKEKALREAISKEIRKQLMEGTEAWWSNYGTTFTVKNAYHKGNKDAFDKEEFKIQDASAKVIKVLQKVFKGMEIEDVMIVLKKK